MWDPETFRERRYDFHAACILRLVESAIRPATDPTPDAPRAARTEEGL